MSVSGWDAFRKRAYFRGVEFCLMMAGGEWTVLLDHDDEITGTRFYRVVKEINDHPDARFDLSDEDLIDERGVRSEPKI